MMIRSGSTGKETRMAQTATPARSTAPTPAASRPDHGTDEMRAGPIYLALLILLALWGGAIFLFGVPGLYLPALALVPVVYAALLLITVGK